MKPHNPPDWNSLVKEFGALIGAEGLEIESAGACRLELGGSLGIDFEKDLQGGLHLYCTLPPVREQERPASALRLLAANYSAQREHSLIAFAFDEASGDFLVHLQLPETIHTMEDFEIAVRDFTDRAEHWTQMMLDGLTEYPSVATENQPPSFA